MESVIVRSAQLVGLDAHPVTVTVARSPGPVIDIAGMSEPAAREARIRVRAALNESVKFDFPRHGYRVTVSPPAERGAALDLPIAAGILALRDGHEIPEIIVGELSLSGEVRPVRGIVSILELAMREGRSAIIPLACRHEASFTSASVHLVRTLKDLESIDPLHAGQVTSDLNNGSNEPDFSELVSVPMVQAIETAVATGKNLLLLGAMGTGRLQFARRATTIMPELMPAAQLDLARVQSAAGLPVHAGVRPFRAPHHTASTIALTGGGNPVRPGEATLAHHGVLFLDDVHEMRREALSAVARTNREGYHRLMHEGRLVSMPAKPLIIGTMALCPCGARGGRRPAGERGVMGAQTGCHCTPERVVTYLARLRPQLEEIFPLAHVAEPLPLLPKSMPVGESSKTIRERIALSKFDFCDESFQGPVLSHPALAFATVMKLATPSVSK